MLFCNISTVLGVNASEVIFFPIVSIALRIDLFLLGDEANFSIFLIPTKDNSELIFFPIIGNLK